MRKLFWIAILAPMYWANAASADQAIIMGDGGESCGAWTARKSNPVTEAARNQWVFGYISGFNVYTAPRGGDITQGTDWQGVVAWMDNYCRTYPLDTIQAAALNLILELQKKASSATSN
jgi:hypothetical protein